MIVCQSIFRPAAYDDVHSLDGQIDAFARPLPGFRDVETWISRDGALANVTRVGD